MKASVFVVLAAFWAPAARAQMSAGEVSLELHSSPGGGGAALSGGDVALRGEIAESAWAGDGLNLGAAGASLRRGLFGTPWMSYQRSLLASASNASGSMAVSLPASSVPFESFDIGFRQDPESNPWRVDPALIRAANERMRANEGVAPSAEQVWEIGVLGESGFLEGATGARGSIALGYQDVDNDGFVDGSNPPIKTKTVKLWMLDEASGLWVKLPEQTAGGSRVAAPLGHLSVFALIGTLDASVDDVYAYPVPYRPFGPQAGSGANQTGTEAAGITFTNLPSSGKIEIFTPSGRRVKTIDIPANLVPARLAWDARNDEGARVGSGVYLWRAVSATSSKLGRLMVIW